jgi:hypothetical protein
VRERVKILGKDGMDTALSFHRILNHVQHVEIARFHNVFNQMDNEDIRIHFLLGNISGDAMKVEIQKREKKREKERAQRRACEVLVQGGTDLLGRIMAETDKDKEKEKAKKLEILKEVDALRIYVNELLAKIHERMKLSVPQYTAAWATTYPFTAKVKKEVKPVPTAVPTAATVTAP